VQFEGKLKDVKGKCPNLSFTVSGHRIETSGSTTFKGLSCSGLDDKATVKVTGTERSNGTIDATIVEKD
jgi:hypothetical protein